MSNHVYIITREGVYRHEILGIWDNEAGAFAEAERLKEIELLDEHKEFPGRKNSHHTIAVNTAPVNARIEDVKRVKEFEGFHGNSRIFFPSIFFGKLKAETKK